MKSYVYSTVSAAVLSAALIASPVWSQGAGDSVSVGLAQLGYDAPAIESLTAEELGQITNVLNSQDQDLVKRNRIDQILGNEATATGNLGVAQLRDSASADMAMLGIDTEVVDSLTMSQLAQIENALSGQDSTDVKKARVEEIIGGEATATSRLGVTQLQDSAAADLAAMGIDTEAVDSLTISQLGQIENMMSSSMSDQEKRAQVELIMNQ